MIGVFFVYAYIDIESKIIYAHIEIRTTYLYANIDFTHTMIYANIDIRRAFIYAHIAIILSMYLYQYRYMNFLKKLTIYTYIECQFYGFTL